MDQLIGFLNNNVGFVGGILSLVIAISTVVYAFFTYSLSVETKKLRKVQSDPLLSIIIEPYKFAFIQMKIIIQNIGQGPAYNISFTCEPNIDIGNNKHLSDLNFLKQHSYLKPNQKIESYIASYQNLVNKEFSITAKFESMNGEQYTEKFTFNVSDMAGVELLGGDSIYNIAENTKNIYKEITNLNKTVKNLKEN